MKKIISLLIILVLAGCSSITDKVPKRKSCDGSKNTVTDLLCKK